MASSTNTQLDELSDLQLDITLEHCYREHRDATLGRRAIIHKVIVDVLAEQKTRRDEWLSAGERVTSGST